VWERPDYRDFVVNSLEDEFSRIPTIEAEICTSPYPMCSLLSCEPRLHEVSFTRFGSIQHRRIAQWKQSDC
jgi:hypothetical protein